VARWNGTGWLEATQKGDQAATRLAGICREEENNLGRKTFSQQSLLFRLLCRGEILTKKKDGPGRGCYSGKNLQRTTFLKE